MAKKAPTAKRAKKPSRKPKWTVMVYMGTADPSGKQPLDVYADKDHREMSRISSDKFLNIFVQEHGKDVPRRRHVKVDAPWEEVPDYGRDTAGGQALLCFIEWALTKANHRPGDYTLLVLWGHAFRFAVASAKTTTGYDALDFGEISGVLDALQKKMGGKRLSIVGFDACDLATIEVAYRLRGFADYLVASEMIIPLPGWPYHRVLDELQQSRDRVPMQPENLGEYIIRRFCEQYLELRPEADSRSVSLTLINLQRAEEVFAKTEALARRICESSNEPGAERELAAVQECFQLAQTFSKKPFIDVASLCLHLSRRCSLPTRRAARRLGDLLVRPDVKDTTPVTKRGSFIVEHGRNSHATAMLNGVSLYAPNVAVGTHNIEKALDGYSLVLHGVPRQRLSPDRERNWSQLIYALAGAAH